MFGFNDVDDQDAIALDDDAFGAAIEAATEANHAGEDEQRQIESAIKTYLWIAGR